MIPLRHHVSRQRQAGIDLLLAPVAYCRASSINTSSRQRRCFHQQGGKLRVKSKDRTTPQIQGLGHANNFRAPMSSEACVSQEPVIHSVFEEKTGTWQYVVADPSSQKAVIIDPVLDYDLATQVISSHTADSLLSMIKEKGYKVERILETHAHADHLTAASYIQDCLAKQLGYRPPISIGKRIGQVQRLFGQRYGIPAQEYDDVFDKLLDDDETFEIGNLTATTLHLPGHTPDHVGYKIGANVFCGDSIFHTDIGTARCDFPGGSADDLFNSGRKLLAMPDDTKIWIGHDYPPDGRGAPVPSMTVRDHKRNNMHLQENMNKADFVTLRQARDAKLAAPKLLHQSLQINIRAGRLPKPTASGHSFLQQPLHVNSSACQAEKSGI